MTRRTGPDHKRLPPRPWMRDRAVHRIMRALDGGRGDIRFVGGCVRDSLIGLPVRDIDLAVRCRPLETLRRLKRAGIATVPVGIEHGVVLALCGGRAYEVASLRRDVETDGRRARVAYSRDWRQDAERRDFTINALYADSRGRLYDPFGGWADLRRGVVRFVGDAQARVREDRLRVLRYYRFFARYGRGRPDARAGQACRAAAAHLGNLSAERVRDELKRLLESAHCRRGLDLMAEHGVLARILPEAGDRNCLGKLSALDGPWPAGAPIRRLAALLRPAADAAALARRLKMSKAEERRLTLLHATVAAPPPLENAGDLRRLIYRSSPEAAADLLLLHLARRGEPALSQEWTAIIKNWRPPALPLSGDDLLALGLEPGPGLGALLKEVESWWEDGDFRAGRAACLDYAAAAVARRDQPVKAN